MVTEKNKFMSLSIIKNREYNWNYTKTSSSNIYSENELLIILDVV